MSIRRAKIVCTLGPASNTEAGISGLIEAGMDVARLNFSHGTGEEHAAVCQRVREVSAELKKPIGVLQDLGGPKIRTRSGPPSLSTGAQVTLSSKTSDDPEVLVIDYRGFEREVKEGDRIMLGDGDIELRVREAAPSQVVCYVEHGGLLRARMGVNLPSSRLSIPALTDKDRKDVEVGLEIGVDYFALSFVRRVEDILELRALCESRGKPTPIVAKIETPSAVQELDAIAQAADAVMVARGDLGVELLPELVPVIQRKIVGACRKHNKPVIVATEMLQSMVGSPRPTRAETSDVAAAVFGGADALMLSAESATGKYPTQACRMMAKIISEAEKSEYYEFAGCVSGESIAGAVACAAGRIAQQVNAKLIVALTESGTTARLVSKARPTVPIVGISPRQRTVTRMALDWGTTPHSFNGLERGADLEASIRQVQQYLTQNQLAGSGDRYVLVYGAKTGVPGSTNSLRVEQL